MSSRSGLIAAIRDTRLSQALSRVFNAAQYPDGGRPLNTPQEIEQAIRNPTDDATGVTVTEGSAMRVAAVYACVALLTRSQAMLRQTLFRQDAQGKLTEERKHPVAKILRQPNTWQTPFDFESMCTAHKKLRGNSYSLITRGGDGRPLMLTPLDPSQMTVVQNDSLELVYKYRRPNGTVITFAAADIHHRRELVTNGFVGMSPLEAARQAIGMSMQMRSYSGGLFKNAAVPSGVLTHPKALSEPAQKRLKDQFEERYTGAENAGRPLLLEEGLSWVKLGMTAEDTQFIESRKFERAEIAMFYGVPPHMIGDVERGTSWGSGIEQQSLGFLVHTLLPHLINDEQALARDLLTDAEREEFVIKHDVAILTRADFLNRQQGLQIQKQNGVINANEWRKVESYNPREDEGGEEYRDTGGVALQPGDPSGQDPGDDGAGTQDRASDRSARRRQDRREANGRSR